MKEIVDDTLIAFAAALLVSAVQIKPVREVFPYALVGGLIGVLAQALLSYFLSN